MFAQLIHIFFSWPRPANIYHNMSAASVCRNQAKLSICGCMGFEFTVHWIQLRGVSPQCFEVQCIYGRLTVNSIMSNSLLKEFGPVWSALQSRNIMFHWWNFLCNVHRKTCKSVLQMSFSVLSISWMSNLCYGVQAIVFGYISDISMTEGNNLMHHKLWTLWHDKELMSVRFIQLYKKIHSWYWPVLRLTKMMVLGLRKL